MQTTSNHCACYMINCSYFTYVMEANSQYHAHDECTQNTLQVMYILLLKWLLGGRNTLQMILLIYF